MAFRRCGAEEPCGSWQRTQAPPFSTAWTTFLSRPMLSFLWQSRQSGLPCFFRTSLGTMPWRRWHASHGRSLETACVYFAEAYFSANLVWQSRQSLPLKLRCAEAAPGRRSTTPATSAASHGLLRPLVVLVTAMPRSGLSPSAADARDEDLHVVRAAELVGRLLDRLRHPLAHDLLGDGLADLGVGLLRGGDLVEHVHDVVRSEEH